MEGAGVVEVEEVVVFLVFVFESYFCGSRFV